MCNQSRCWPQLICKSATRACVSQCNRTRSSDPPGRMRLHRRADILCENLNKHRCFGVAQVRKDVPRFKTCVPCICHPAAADRLHKSTSHSSHCPQSTRFTWKDHLPCSQGACPEEPRVSGSYGKVKNKSFLSSLHRVRRQLTRTPLSRQTHKRHTHGKSHDKHRRGDSGFQSIFIPYFLWYLFEYETWCCPFELKTR